MFAIDVAEARRRAAISGDQVYWRLWVGEIALKGLSKCARCVMSGYALSCSQRSTHFYSKAPTSAPHTAHMA